MVALVWYAAGRPLSISGDIKRRYAGSEGTQSGPHTASCTLLTKPTSTLRKAVGGVRVYFHLRSQQAGSSRTVK